MAEISFIVQSGWPEEWEKIAEILEKVAQIVCQSKKWQNILVKAQLKVQNIKSFFNS